MAQKKATEKAASPAQAATPAPPAEKHFRIIAMQVENVKRLSCVRIRPKGNLITVSGANGSGKSSILQSIAWALTGERGIPSQPIKKGKDSGRIEVDLGDYRVTRHFTRVHGGKEPFLTRLEITGKNREKFPSPQAIMDKLRSVISFDPLAFIGMEDKKQLEVLRKLVTLDIDLDKIDEDRKAAYDDRRLVGRDLDGAKARLSAAPAPEEGTPLERVNTDELHQALQDADAGNRNRLGQEAKQREHLLKAEAHRQTGGRLDQEVHQLQERIKELGLNIQTEAKLEQKERAAADKVTIPDLIDTEPIMKRIQFADAANQAVSRAGMHRSITAELERIDKRWNDLDELVKGYDKTRAEAIERAKMPMEKLGIGDGEVLYDGLPFSQASNAEQIRVSVALAIASNPQLRVLRIMDGSLLDSKSLDMIEKMADEHDFQIWIERVEAGGKVGIVMEDGEASGDDVEAATEPGAGLSQPLKQ